MVVVTVVPLVFTFSLLTPLWGRGQNTHLPATSFALDLRESDQTGPNPIEPQHAKPKKFRPFGSAGPNPRTRRVKKSWSLVCHLRTYDWRCHFTLIRIVGGRRYLMPDPRSSPPPPTTTNHQPPTTKPPTTNHNPKMQNLCALTGRR